MATVSLAANFDDLIRAPDAVQRNVRVGPRLKEARDAFIASMEAAKASMTINQAEFHNFPPVILNAFAAVSKMLTGLEDVQDSMVLQINEQRNAIEGMKRNEDAWTALIEKKTKEAATGATGQRKQMRITESKSVQTLKIFSGAQRSEFKEWIDKLINQFSVIYPGSRCFFKSLIKVMNEKRKHPDEEDIKEALDEGLMDIADQENINEDMYYILMDKTSGECHDKVTSSEAGDGLNAFCKIFLWYASSSGLALQERTRNIMNPTPPKKE